MGTCSFARRWLYFVLALTAVLSGSSFAADFCTGRYGVRSAVLDSNAESVYGSTAAAACAAAGGTTGDNSYIGTVNSGGGGCDITITQKGVFSGVVYHQFTQTPVCTPGPPDSVKKCTDAKGSSDWFSGFKSLPKVGSSFCPSDGEASGCGSTVDGGYCTVKNGVRSCAHEVKYTGSTCTPPAPSTEEPKQDPCKGSSGTVNGVTVCVPVGTDPKVTVETGKTSTETTTKPGENGGPSTTTTTTTDKNTTCTGNQCTTTTTTTTGGAGGASGGTGSGTSTTTEKSEPKEDFCKENAQAALCKNSTFGGSCSAAFTCDGDAIMCAIAKDQLQRNCQALDPDKDSGSVTNKALSGEDKLNTEEMKATAKAAPVQVGSFNTSGRGWGRSCPADPVIAIPWAQGTATQWSIPFSRLCGPLGLLANAAVAVTLLGALAWVVGGSKAAA